MSKLFGAEVHAKLFMPKGSSSWQIDGLIKKGEYDNALLLSFLTNDQEIFDVRKCFEDVTHIFAFGRNAQACVLNVSILIVLYNGCPKSNKSNWLKLDQLRKKYAEKRIYKNDKPLKITLDDLSMSGFLIGMSIGDINPMTKTAVADFTFILDQES